MDAIALYSKQVLRWIFKLFIAYSCHSSIAVGQSVSEKDNEQCLHLFLIVIISQYKGGRGALVVGDVHIAQVLVERMKMTRPFIHVHNVTALVKTAKSNLALTIKFNSYSILPLIWSRMGQKHLLQLSPFTL